MTIRGLWTHAGVLYSVEDDTLYSIDSANLKTDVGVLNSTAGAVDFASNLTQLCVNDVGYLYVYAPDIGAFTTSADYPGGARISFLDQRIIFQYLGTQKFGWTALADATQIDLLDFYSAESSPDTLVAQITANREIMLLGEESGEIWDSVGGTEVFSRSSAAIDFGCVAANTLQKTPNSVIWLGRDRSGQAMVLSSRGHQTARISTRAEEEKFEGIELSGATAFTYTDGPHSFYCLNVPALDTTLTWDETFGQWHERGEWDGTYSKWRPTCHAFAYGRHYFGGGDTLYVSDPSVHTFGGDVKRRQRIAPVISKPSRTRVSFPKFEVVCEKGTGATVMLRWSDDNGANWSSWNYTTVGQVGDFARSAAFYRLGSAYDRVFDLVFTDDAPFNPVMVDVPL
jgi:hypothetical protein